MELCSLGKGPWGVWEYFSSPNVIVSKVGFQCYSIIVLNPFEAHQSCCLQTSFLCILPQQLPL
jgi:hypothetical protein